MTLATLGPGRPGNNLGSGIPGFAGSVAVEGGRKLAARAHRELAVDLGQVPLHGAGAELQRPRRLGVRVAGGDELGDPALGGAERVPRRCAPSPDPAQLLPRPLAPRLGARGRERVTGVLEGEPRVALRARPAQDAAVRELGASPLEPPRLAVVVLERPFEGGARPLEIAGGRRD